MQEFKEIRAEYWEACKEFNKTFSTEAWDRKAKAEKALHEAWKKMGLA